MLIREIVPEPDSNDTVAPHYYLLSEMYDSHILLPPLVGSAKLNIRLSPTENVTLRLPAEWYFAEIRS